MTIDETKTEINVKNASYANFESHSAILYIYAY